MVMEKQKSFPGVGTHAREDRNPRGAEKSLALTHKTLRTLTEGDRKKSKRQIHVRAWRFESNAKLIKS